MERMSDDTAPSEEAVRIAELVQDNLARCFPLAVTTFEERWSAWLVLCQSMSVAEGAPLDPCLDSVEYDNVKRLGPKIVPMLVYKLAIDPEQNSHGVYLYRALENDPIYQISIDDSAVSRERLRQLSNVIVQLNHQRYEVYRTRLLAWKSLCNTMGPSSSYKDATETVEYDELLDMGTSIIALLMIAYHADPDFWYWELLHEIIHGRETQAFQFSTGELYMSCENWFNEGENSDAPVYQFSELERDVFSKYPGGRPPYNPPYERGNPRY